MDRTARLLHYFVHRFSGRLGRTQLVKLLYLVDHEARRFLGRPITDLTWRRHTFGPWSDAFKRLSLELREEGWIEERRVCYATAIGHAVVDLRGQADLSDLSPAERLVVETVAEKFGTTPLELLLRFVYATAPMKGARRGERLAMEALDGAAAQGLGGLDLESVARGLDDARAGRVRSAEALVDELTARHRRPG